MIQSVFSSASNTRVIEALKAPRYPVQPGDQSRRREADEDYLRLGTHPELVERLWDKITLELPEDCRCIVCGRPALVRPSTGVIFGLATGTIYYALRLSEELRNEALQMGAARSFTDALGREWGVEDFGPEWVMGNWQEQDTRWCRAAYDFAGLPEPEGSTEGEQTISDRMKANEAILAKVDELGGGSVWESEIFTITLMDVAVSDDEALFLTGLWGVEQIAIDASRLSFETLLAIAGIKGLDSLVLSNVVLSVEQEQRLAEQGPEVEVVNEES